MILAYQVEAESEIIIEGGQYKKVKKFQINLMAKFTMIEKKS